MTDTVYGDMQKLEAGNRIHLYILDASALGLVEVGRFHGYTRVGPIYWQGNEYSPWPIVAAGFGRTNEKPPTPTLTLGNVDGSIGALCRLYQDMLGAKLIRKRTFGKYLDAANFGGVNPTADPDQEFPEELWFVERKVSEDFEQVSFELASAMDYNGVELPRRPILANLCHAVYNGGYRGPYCGYVGPPVAERDDTPTSDPLLDKCGGRLSSCKLRFGEHGKLPFGAFPAAGLFR